MNIDELYRIQSLERRVLALEQQHAKTDTHDGRCVVPEARILRWERIERAADAVADWIRDADERWGKSDWHPRLLDLLEARKP